MVTPQTIWTRDFTQTWPIVSTPTNNTCYMGKRHFCLEELENSPVILSNFTAIILSLYYNATGMWCNTDITGKAPSPEANKTCNNIGTKN